MSTDTVDDRQALRDGGPSPTTCKELLIVRLMLLMSTTTTTGETP